MKKLLLNAAIGSALLGLGFVGGFYTNTVKSNDGEQIIKGDMVKITLTENKKGGYFDLLVEPTSKNINVSSGWDLDANSNYESLYLSGLTQDKYNQLWTDARTQDILNNTKLNPKYSWGE